METIPHAPRLHKTSQCQEPSGTGLIDLPNELIGIIATHLIYADLLRLRGVGNRMIHNGIDHIWAEETFTRRTCQTTDASIAHLGIVARSRFAKYIRSISIDFNLRCRTPTKRHNIEGVNCAPEPCVDANICLISLYSKLIAIFKQAVNLEKLVIGAPPPIAGLSDQNFQSTWYMESGSGPYMMFGPLSRLRRTHYHILDLNSSRTILDSITMAMREIRLPLVEFRAIDFTSTSWQSALGSTIPMLSALVELPNMGHLTRLDLELDMFSDNSNSAMNALVKIIDKNCALQNLKLSTGPRLEQTFRIRHQHWSPFMHLLGSSPSFRLRSLDLEGLITSGTMMLDQIIHAHAGTLRDIVLDNTNFGTPNSLRNFFMELSKTDLELFAIRNFWFHDNSWLSGSTWSYHHRPDEVLDCFDDEMLSKDEAYLDWVDISWESASYRKWIRWDNRDGRHGNFWMKECLMNVVEMVDCCDMDDD